MNDKICISLGNVDFITCLQLAVSTPLVEVRLDLMRLSTEQIEILAMQCRRWVATCRPGHYTERERTVQLSAAIRAGATYVDIEYEAEPEYRQTLTELAKRLHSKVIISYHNFESTLGIDTLNQIIGHSLDMGADLVKIAVTAHATSDCARILSLYEHHHRLIAFAMGKIGTVTRIAAPLLGAEFTFAAVDEKHLTAPGQLTASQMEVIYQVLEKSV